MTAGYSKRPLVAKLGIKPGYRVYIVNQPDGYAGTLGTLPADVTLFRKAASNLNFIHLFSLSRNDLERRFASLKTRLVSDGMLWVSWPKKSSGVETDLDEGFVRKVGLQNGLVDVKICAVDEVWSGLKFVYRLKDRT